ncbi:Non-reducing polyketide synthase PKS8-1 [Elasticomyces elasticus]|nr:Non-reducing polyketide synthase PKS8-1 [Elasticomyces elasticus]
MWCYRRHIEAHPSELSTSTKTSLCALGVGLLSSAAVSAASTPTELALLGADVVRIAFRMGIHVFNVSSDLSTIESEHKIDALNVAEQVSDTGKIFISAVSRTSITISGPPSRLKSILNKCELLRSCKYISLPVYGGLCHAPHIYGSTDVTHIVRSDNMNALHSTYPVVRPLRSTSSGLPYQANDALEMFERVVSELLTQAISWDRVIGDLVDEATSSAAAKSTIQSFCNSMPLNDLRNALENITTVSTDNLVSWVLQTPSPGSKVNGNKQSKLAIVGMACRLPGGVTNTEQFWDVLAQGLDVSRKIPADRFDIETHYDATGTDMNKSMTQYGCFIDEPGLFDAPFFNMSPREAQVVDPQMRLSLVTAYEALERAGYVANRTLSTKTERIGTFYGQAADDYREVNQGQEVSTYYIPGGCRAFGPGRINYFFKFAGPSYSIDTACSSRLAAVEVACQALWSGDIDMAVTGGVNILTNPDGFTGLGKGHFLTKGQNACKTWDASADGYCRADGVGSLVLKRLEDAEADNDKILGVILGAGTNHSAEKISITHPHAGHQAYLARQVLRQAGVDPLDVSYIELHGTGTQAGDTEEMQGIAQVYAPLVKRRRKDQPLHIGAVKANVGHGESVAGTTALLKVLLMLEKNAIPQHVGIKTEMNPNLIGDLEKRNLRIPLEMTPWPKEANKKRLVAINNFGAAGGNTTMVLEEAPTLAERQRDPRKSHVITLSAKTRVSLAGNIQRLIDYLNAQERVELSDLSYTTTARRYHHSFRIAVAPSDQAQLRKLLTSRLEQAETVKPVGKSDQPQIAFTFTGQGAAYKSMNLELYHHAPIFKQHVLHLDALGRRQGFPSIIPALDGTHPQDYAHSPVVTQLALVCSQIAPARYWASLGVKPDVVCHSLGEYAALHVAGVSSANDAIFLVGKRAEQLQQHCTIGSHAMMAVRASLSQIVDGAAGKKYTVACINGPTDTVLSGTAAEMDDVAGPLEKAGHRCIKLDVAFAFHSEQTDPILDGFEALASTGVVFHEPKLPFISPLFGKVIFDGKTLNAHYVR